MTTDADTSAEDTDRYPETLADCDDAHDPRQLTPDTDERDPEEAGYGYGV
jgi:hypothetical protein